MKTCRRCSTEKDVSEFHKQARAKDGLQRSCKTCCKEIGRIFREANPEKTRAYVNKCAAANREKRRVKSRERYQADIDRQRMRAAKYAKENPAKMAAQARKFRARPDRAVHGRIGAQIRYALGHGKGGIGAFELLGYGVDDLMRHLERQFTKGMGWDNMGEWHIDHIVPVSSFHINGASDPAIREVWALSNLRPLWATENVRKHSKRMFLI